MNNQIIIRDYFIFLKELKSIINNQNFTSEYIVKENFVLSITNGISYNIPEALKAKFNKDMFLSDKKDGCENLALLPNKYGMIFDISNVDWMCKVLNPNDRKKIRNDISKLYQDIDIFLKNKIKKIEELYASIFIDDKEYVSKIKQLNDRKISLEKEMNSFNITKIFSGKKQSFEYEKINREIRFLNKLPNELNDLEVAREHIALLRLKPNYFLNNNKTSENYIKELVLFLKELIQFKSEMFDDKGVLSTLMKLLCEYEQINNGNNFISEKDLFCVKKFLKENIILLLTKCKMEIDKKDYLEKITFIEENFFYKKTINQDMEILKDIYSLLGINTNINSFNILRTESGFKISLNKFSSLLAVNKISKSKLKNFICGINVLLLSIIKREDKFIKDGRFFNEDTKSLIRKCITGVQVNGEELNVFVKNDFVNYIERFVVNLFSSISEMVENESVSYLINNEMLIDKINFAIKESILLNKIDDRYNGQKKEHFSRKKI